MTGPFLICDLRPDWNRLPYVTFWRPNNANYAYPLVWAGDYTEADVMKAGRYYTTVERGVLIRFPILRSLVEPMGIAPDAGRVDGDTGPVVRNDARTRKKLRDLAFKAAVVAFAIDGMKLTHSQKSALVTFKDLFRRHPGSSDFRAFHIGSSTVGHLRRMEPLGLVKVDRRYRNFYYSLTAEGKKVAEAVAAEQSARGAA